MNSNGQRIPRICMPEAIIDGKAEGYPWVGKSIEHQFAKFAYPAPGHSPVHMLYKYGGSILSTMNNTNRWVKMYQSPNLEFVVNQSIWFEGEAKFADVILPACTNFERTDISEWAGLGGYGHHGQQQLNHRVIVFQAPAIEPLGESKSDFWIFNELCKPLGLANYFSEGCNEIDWVKRRLSRLRPAEGDLVARSSSSAATTSCRPRRRSCARRCRSAGSGRTARRTCRRRSRCRPTTPRNICAGLQTQSGKLEFECNSLKRFNDPERPPIVKYEPSWEGPHSGEMFERYPLQTAHAALEIFVPHPGRRQGFVPAQHRGPPRQGRGLLLLDHAHERRGRGRARHQEARPGQGLQRPRRGDLRGAADAAAAARRLPRLRVLGGLRSDGRARQIGRSRRLPQPAHAASARRPRSTHSLAGANSLVQIELWDGRIEHMSETFAAMEKDKEIKRTLQEAHWCRRSDMLHPVPVTRRRGTARRAVEAGVLRTAHSRRSAASTMLRAVRLRAHRRGGEKAE